jgi:hypothetical protein
MRMKEWRMNEWQLCQKKMMADFADTHAIL